MVRMTLALGCVLGAGLVPLASGAQKPYPGHRSRAGRVQPGLEVLEVQKF
jgi:hypothetical protein